MSNLDANYLLTEDLALKTALQGVVVSDGNSPSRPLGVWFGQADPEIRAQQYPYATIDLIDAVENTQQVHSQWGPLDNQPYLMAKLPSGQSTTSQAYGLLSGLQLLPMILVYQISTWARHPRHDRAIIAQLQAGPLHPRFASITCGDGTARRVVVRSYVKRDTTTENKRLYRNIWTVAIPSELFQGSVALTQRVTTVKLNSATVTRAPTSQVNTPTYYPGT